MTSVITTAFQFEGKPIRIFMDEVRGAPWLCAKDVWEALGWLDMCEMGRFLKTHCKAAGLAKCAPLDTLNPTTRLVFIDERNCYRLLDAACLRAAERVERFDRWLAQSVLPELRRTKREASAQGVTRAHIRDAFCSQRWLVDSFDIDGQPIFIPLASHTIVVKPELLADVLRQPGPVPLSLLPDMIRACIDRLEAAQQVHDPKD